MNRRREPNYGPVTLAYSHGSPLTEMSRTLDELKVEVHVSNETALLRAFELMDTPGLFLVSISDGEGEIWNPAELQAERARRERGV